MEDVNNIFFDFPLRIVDRKWSGKEGDDPGGRGSVYASFPHKSITTKAQNSKWTTRLVFGTMLNTYRKYQKDVRRKCRNRKQVETLA